MYYLNSRYYNPELCRFISADSFDYINNKTKLSLNAYAYCQSDPINYYDTNGNQRNPKIPDSDDPGQIRELVAELIGIIFVIDAMEIQYGKDFAAFIATALAFDIDKIKIDENATKEEIEKQKEKSREEFDKWVEGLYERFVEATNTTTYKVLKAFNDNFFVEFCSEIMKIQSRSGRVTVGESVEVTIGIGNKDETVSQILDLLDGKIKIAGDDVVEFGIFNKDSIAVYISTTFSILDELIWENITVNFELNIDDFPNFPDFPVFDADEINSGIRSAAVTVITVAIVAVMVKVLSKVVPFLSFV